MREPWSDTDKKTAIQMRNKGCDYHEIADVVGRSYDAVQGFLKRRAKKEIVEVTPNDKTKQKIADARQEVAGLKKRIKELEKLTESQGEALKEARAPRVAIKVGDAPTSESGDFCRVIIPDSHGCYIDHDAAAAFLADLEVLSPREIVMLGDHLDCGGFLAQHQTLNFIPEASYTFEQDVAACNQFLDEIQSRAPHAKIHYILGNHEARISRWCIKQTMNNPDDAAMLYKTFGPEQVLHLDSRDISVYRPWEYYDGLSVPATFKLGHCHFTHGICASQNAAKDTLQKFGGNVVFGHSHRRDSYTINNVSAGILGAWNPGCLCVRQRLWQYPQVSQWSHGYGVQLVRENGDFLHINVPIINGRSYMMPLLESPQRSSVS